MNNGNLTRFVSSMKLGVSKHSPTILTGLGIAGMITSTVLAVKDTPKALDLINKKKEEEKVDKLTKVEVVKTCWKCYIPSIIISSASIACLVGASSVNYRRNAVLATAYKLSENTLNEYRSKVKEVIGDEKEKEIRSEISKDKMKENPVSRNEVIVTGKGEFLCYDELSGRYFRSDTNKIRKAENTLNRKLMNEMYVSVNEFYDLIGLPYTQIGHDLGWNVDSGDIEIDFYAELTEDEEPCIAISFSVQPKQNYSSLM